MARPLEDVRILEWGSAHAGPGAGYMLADLGAEVIKIESRQHPDLVRRIKGIWSGTWGRGADINWMLEWTNRGKKSIVIDFSKEKGRELLYKLVAKCDVFETNYNLEVIRRNGADYETLKRYNPKLVYALSSGTGTKGPYAEGRLFDMTAQALAGWCFQSGDRDLEGDQPTCITMGLADQTSATVFAYAILAGLVHRDKTGRGVKVESSLLGACVHLQVSNILAAEVEGRPAARFARKRARNPLGNHYKCADDKWLCVAEVDSQRFWHQFCEALEKPELEKDSRFEDTRVRADNCKELIRILDEVFITKPRQHWLELLHEKCGGMAFSPMNTVNDLLTDEQILANDYIVDLDYPGVGTKKTPGCPIKFDGYETRPEVPAPELGEHTEQILSDVLGLSSDEVAKLKEEEII